MSEGYGRSVLCTCSGLLTLGTADVVDYALGIWAMGVVHFLRRPADVGDWWRCGICFGDMGDWCECTCSSLLTLGTDDVVDYVLGIWAIGVVPADVGDWWRCCAGDYVRCELLALLPLDRPDITVMVDWA